MELRSERPDSLQRLILLAAVILLAILSIAMAIQGYGRVAKKLRTHSDATVNDLARWTLLVPELLHQHADYVDDGFPYPPIVLAIFAPLTWVSQPAAQAVWVCAKFALILWIFVLLRRIVHDAGGRLDPAALALALFIWLWAIIGDLQEGQTNLVMLLPLLLGLRLIQARRRPTDLAGGLLIALAVSIKVTPLIFVVYLVLQRRWLALAAAAVGLLMWLLLVPGLLFGWQQNLTWLGQWAQIMIFPYVRHGEIHYYSGQSLASFFARIFQHVPAFTAHDTTGGGPRYVNLLALPDQAVRWITRAVLLVVAAAGAWWMRRPLESFRGPRFVLQIGCVAAFMLWASERTWIHHYVTLILPLIALAMTLAVPGLPPRAQRLGFAALLFAAVAMLLTSDLARIFGRNGGDYVRAVGLPLLASVGIVAAALYAGRAPRHPSP